MYKLETFTPLVSIVIPSYNGARYLKFAIESVLAQSYKNWEIIVVDDASTDDTRSIVSEYLARYQQIHYICNEQNLGISKSRNYGISHSRGTYVAMLDSDDVWLDINKLKVQVHYLEKNSDCVVVGTWMIQIDEKGNLLKKISFSDTNTEIRKSILYKNHIAQSSVLFRKDVALEVGGYDETLATMEDHDMWLKMGVKNKFATLPIYTLGYRVHQGGITKSRKLRVALDEITVIWRHRHEYPGLLIGITKGITRVLRAIF